MVFVFNHFTDEDAVNPSHHTYQRRRPASVQQPNNAGKHIPQLIIAVYFIYSQCVYKGCNKDTTDKISTLLRRG